MKSIPAPLLADYQARSRSTAWGLLVRRRDWATSAAQIALTSSDLPVTLTGVPIAGVATGAVDFDPAPGLNVSSIESAIGMEVGNFEGELLDVGLVERADVYAGRWDAADWTLFQYAAAVTGSGINVVRTGQLGRVSIADGSFKVEFRDWRSLAKANATEATQATCRSEFGDTRAHMCQLDLAPHTHADQIITAVASQRQFAVGALALADGTLDLGVATWTLGANAGLSMRIRTQVGTLVTLDRAMVLPIAEDDEVTLVDGCDKSITMCIERYDNARRFRGEPYKPRPTEAQRPLYPEDSADFPVTNPEIDPHHGGGGEGA